VTSTAAFEDYVLAVSNPARFFSDPEIQRRVGVPDRLGQPTFFAGRYAFTFRLTLPDGTAPIAVRCFQQEVGAIVDRYRAIDEFLRRIGSDFFVGFAVSAPTAAAPRQGVLVKGRWLPTMRMDWVEGLTLAQFVQDHCRDPKALQAARDGLLAYAKVSERSGFAHGDIHPDNIVVDGARKLRFVDYDGMYVPRLDRFGGEVAGQADYQSPLRMREPTSFGPWLDRFPLLVLDVTLAALQLQPDLLERRTQGEGLLLGQADFDAPEQSALLAEIALLPTLDGAVRVFREACRRPLGDIPPLDLMRRAARLRPAAERHMPTVLAGFIRRRPRVPHVRWPSSSRLPAGRAALALVVVMAACLRPGVVRNGSLPSDFARGMQSVTTPKPLPLPLPRPPGGVVGGSSGKPAASRSVPRTPSPPAREQGRIVMQLQLSPDGLARRGTVRETSGQPGLAEAAWALVTAWQLKPVERGRLAETEVTVSVACDRQPDAPHRWRCLAESIR
jgi:hypothetical protein